MGELLAKGLLAVFLAALITLPLEIACRVGTKAGIEAEVIRYRACFDAYARLGQPTIYEKCGAAP
jgi:hypothetical protein